MKKLICLISFSIFCLAASAQPTSFGGITPGQTTREELQNLVKNPSQVGTTDYAFLLKLIQPDGESVSVSFYDDIVYEVRVYLFSPELKQALIEKYGKPRIKVGSIRSVTCQNNFGASFKRFDGEEEMRWPAKDGVQGAIRSWAGKCGESINQEYLLRHVATVKTMERARLEEARKAAEEKRHNLGNAY